MFKGFKKWLYRMASEGSSQTVGEDRVNKLHDMFAHNIAAMVAFKIDNGYVVRTIDPDAVVQGSRVPGFVYCADHQAIADHIVSSAMRERLGVQQEMFNNTQRKNVKMYIKPPAGLVGSQQATPSY